MRLLPFLPFLVPAALAGELIPYPETPGAVPGTSYAVTVNGQPVKVEQLGDVNYARFMFTGEVEVAVTPTAPSSHFAISPVSYHIATGTTAAGAATFKLSQPRNLIITTDRAEKLLLFADAPEQNAPAGQGAGIVNLTDFLLAPRDPAKPVTAEFQKAIEAASAANDGAGGILYVPNGQYLTGQLKLRDNVHLYLQSGALVKSVAEFSPENFPRQGTNPVDSSFIFIGKARNVSLTGRGVIDGNGLAVRQGDKKANIKLLRAADSSHLRVEGVYFRNSSRWSLHLLSSDDIVFRNFKLINDVSGEPDEQGIQKFNVTNTDGVDVDASSKVTIADSFIYTGDDATSIKVTGYMNLKRPCHDVTIENNVFYSYKCGIRVGDESAADLYDITFRNNDIVRADRAIALYSRDGGRLYHISVLNNRTEYIGGDYNERLFLFVVEQGPKGAKPGPIENVTIKDFLALQPSKQTSTIAGLDASGLIKDVTFENLTIGGKAAREFKDIPLDLKGFTEKVMLK